VLASNRQEESLLRNLFLLALWLFVLFLKHAFVQQISTAEIDTLGLGSIESCLREAKAALLNFL
jgi:hypothetical protein